MMSTMATKRRSKPTCGRAFLGRLPSREPVNTERRTRAFVRLRGVLRPGREPLAGFVRSSAAAVRAATLLCMVLGASRGAMAQEPLVTIEGGALPNNSQMYEWKVTNHHTSPIVFIHFPHYYSDSFFAPAEWKPEWKNQMKAGADDAPGWVQASVADPTRGIPPRGSVTFGVRQSRGGSFLPRPGEVTVRFADGTTKVVANVELPTETSMLERNAMGIGLAVIFVIALTFHFRRHRKTASAASEASPESAPPP